MWGDRLFQDSTVCACKGNPDSGQDISEELWKYQQRKYSIFLMDASKPSLHGYGWLQSSESDANSGNNSLPLSDPDSQRITL